LTWKNFVIKRDVSLNPAEGIKFEKLLFVSKEALKCAENRKVRNISVHSLTRSEIT